MILGEWLPEAQSRLASQGVEAARLESQLLAAHVLLVDRTWILAHPEAPFPVLAGETLLMRRLSGEPLAYILGWREFYGRRFTVRSGVLIPRQDTEVLVETALAVPGDALRVLDIGTGSGILATTLKLERPSWDVTAVDISPLALEIACENAADLGAEIRFLESDLFGSLSGEFDLIVSNPPYIGLEEVLPKEVRDFEPGEALFAGYSGFDIYERLASEGLAFVKPGGLMMMELGRGQVDTASALFERAGWRVVEAVEDLAGISRVLVVSR